MIKDKLIYLRKIDFIIINKVKSDLGRNLKFLPIFVKIKFVYC